MKMMIKENFVTIVTLGYIFLASVGVIGAIGFVMKEARNEKKRVRAVKHEKNRHKDKFNKTRENRKDHSTCGEDGGKA